MNISKKLKIRLKYKNVWYPLSYIIILLLNSDDLCNDSYVHLIMIWIAEVWQPVLIDGTRQEMDIDLNISTPCNTIKKKNSNGKFQNLTSKMACIHNWWYQFNRASLKRTFGYDEPSSCSLYHHHHRYNEPPVISKRLHGLDEVRCSEVLLYFESPKRYRRLY